VNFTAGARVTYDKKDYDGFVDAPQLDAVPIPDERSTPTWTSFTPKAVVDWKPTASALFYASYSEGYKAGGVTQPIVGLPPSSYSPERLKTTELGIKTSWLNNALTANFAGYYSDYKDVQLTSIINLPNGSIVKPTQNAGTAVIRGLEGEIDVMPLPGLRFTLLGDYTHDRFISLLPGTITALHAFIGERLPQIPDYDIHLGAEYGFQIPTGRLTLRVDASVTGEAQMSIGDARSFQNSYTLLNGNLTYDPAWAEHMQFAFRAMNVTNKRYYVYDQTQASLNEQIVIPGAPLEWYLSARYKF
jgi:iron complex outermembrane receptor protein